MKLPVAFSFNNYVLLLTEDRMVCYPLQDFTYGTVFGQDEGDSNMWRCVSSALLTTPKTLEMYLYSQLDIFTNESYFYAESTL